MPYWVELNKEENATRKAAYLDALKAWEAKSLRNSLIKRYPCTKGPYPKTSSGYAIWRDSNGNGVACEPLVQE